MAKTARAPQNDQTEQPEGGDLVAMATVNPLAVFTDREQFSQFYQKIKAETDKHVADVTTERGRIAVRKLAFSVTRAKTSLDKAGLALTEEWRQKTALVNASRKEMVAELDALAKQVRQPLTEWEEAEQARIDGCRAVIEGMKAAAVISIDDTSETVRARGTEVWETRIGEEFGDLADEARVVRETSIATLQRALARLTKEEEDRAELERLRAEAAEREAREAAEREERERVEREREAAEAEERRRQEAEAAEAERVRLAAERAADEAREAEAAKAREAEAARQREYEAQLAEERRQREEAERVAREERERREREEADRQAEADRIERERQEQEAADRRREADRAHRQRVQKAAKGAIMRCGVEEETAKTIVLAIVAGEIPAVSLRF